MSFVGWLVGRSVIKASYTSMILIQKMFDNRPCLLAKTKQLLKTFRWKDMSEFIRPNVWEDVRNGGKGLL